MKLYLHCGYHKTGSSFLQTLFARNRHYLQEEGIHFPVAERELDMISGNISPGNGPELASALRKTDKPKARNLLESYSESAKAKGCSAVLLSCEYFFHAFEKEGSLECLADSATESGITDIEALIYFRDPESHAISTYKHRAKKGTIPDFKRWLENDYETIRLIKRFSEYRETVPVHWTCRLYKSSSDHLAESSFVDWLGIEKPEIPSDDRVNVSLSLSEIMIIQKMKEERPTSTSFLESEFRAISPDKKAPDDEILQNYRKLIRKWMEPFKNLIKNINRSLPEGEKMEIKLYSEIENQNNNIEIVLREEQVIAFAMAIENDIKAERLTHKVKDIFRRGLRKLQRKNIILSKK